MLVLSWDIGIINLAFCLIDYNVETKKFNIVDWDVINLTDRNTIKCSQCKLVPSFYQESTNNYYCKVHSRGVNIIVPEFESLFIEDTTSTCYYEGKTICGKKNKFINESNSYCNIHAKSKYKTICNSYKLIKYSKKNIDKMSMDDFRLKLISCLEERPNLLQSDFVVIENQPAMKNPRMKTIAGCVYDYYTIRGIFDKKITKSLIKTVKFMCPSNKLKLANTGDTMELVKLKGDDSKTYKLTKQLGIKYCSEMIQHLPDRIVQFNSHKKKDDLADCFLQGMYALLNKV